MAFTSITDIAKAAGVAPSTVSRALRDHPRISPGRRAAIRALAQQLGYLPSQAARSLVTGQTRTLGVVVTDVTDPFVGEVMKGAEEASRRAGYSLLFVASLRDPRLEAEGARLLLGRQVDGMIVISSRAAAQYADSLSSRGLPLVLVNNELPTAQVHSVCTDNRGGVRRAVEHLYQLGHSRIAFIAGPEQGRSSQQRLEGYLEAMAELGLPRPPAYLVEGNGLIEDGPRALAALWALEAPPTAVVCYNDLTAIGLLSAAAKHGIRVPSDLSVIGYDNIPLSAYTVPPLTTVEQPKQALGQQAVETCLRVLAGETVSTVVMPAELVVRGSSACCSR